jgi:hypothetical protein
MNLDKRVEKNITSIKNLKNLLIEIIKNPEKYIKDLPLMESLSSQGKLSKYENVDLKIFATSINTMKRLSSYPDCDFEALDKLRVSAIESLKKKENLIGNKITYNKNDLLVKIENLENELNINKNSQLLLLKTISDVNKTLNSIKNVNNVEEMKEHLSLLNGKIKKVMLLDSDFLINMESNNVITVDFKKKD